MFDLHKHILRQIAFSEKTFGPGWRPGVLEHLLKEVEVVRKDPNDL
ncbi:MAG: hypothetical protein KGL39_50485 [Patescibacteria group bacterium]|nr:hypothetical protein [Patescibacteria group bacterium]